MADFTQIIQEINDDINTNGVGAITGAKLNEVLRDMIAAVNAEKQDKLQYYSEDTADERVDMGGTSSLVAQFLENILLVSGNWTIGNYGGSENHILLSNISTGTKLELTENAVEINANGDIVFRVSSEDGVTINGESVAVVDDIPNVSGKADKVSGATNGHFAGLNASGNLTDSGKSPSDFATAAQGTKADTAVQQVTVGTTTTGNAGTNASVTNSGTATAPVLNFTIPRGADGQDGADAVNPFKGWYASANALPANPVVGDYAYVKGASSTDPAAIYECTTAGTWSDSGRTADTSNVQTFASGEEVNEVHIVNDLITGGVHDVLSAEQGKKIYGCTSLTKNLFDPVGLMKIANWVDEGNNTYSGTPIALYNNFYKNGTYYPIANIKANTQYTFSIEGRTTAESSTGNGIYCNFFYSDNTVSSCGVLQNTATEWTKVSGVSTANKTVIGISFNAGTNYNNTWELRNIQLEEGTSLSPFIPYRTAVDYIARNVINDNFAGEHYAIDFSNAQVGWTNYSKYINVNISPNETIELYIFPNDDNRNPFVLNFYNGNTSLFSLHQKGFNKVLLTNTANAIIDKIGVQVQCFDVVMQEPFEIYILKNGEDINARIDYIDARAELVENCFNAYRGVVDFSKKTIGSTYQGWQIAPLSIPAGTAFKIFIDGEDNDENNIYFNLMNGETALATGIGAGYGGKRVINVVNSYGSEITRIDFSIVTMNVAAIYNVAVLIDGKQDLKIEFDGLKNNLSWLPDFLAVPYYFDSQLQTKEAAIKTAMLDAGKNGSTFVFITDVHWPDNSKHSPALIKHILQRLPIENVFYGGDTFNGGTQAESIGYMSDFGTKMHQAAERFFAIKGNHDNNLNDGGEGFDGDYFYTLLLKYADYQVVSGDYNNYYFDNGMTKTRFIVLDTGQVGDHHTSEQSTWLGSALNSMPNGYHAIILLHIAYGTEADLNNNTPAPTMAAAISVADAFNAQNNDKKVEAFISGHLHNDANKTTSGGIPIILTDCDARQTTSGNPQVVGTIGEQAFDVITIDYSGTITCVRVGRGSDRVITY